MMGPTWDLLGFIFFRILEKSFTMHVKVFYESFCVLEIIFIPFLSFFFFFYFVL